MADVFNSRFILKYAFNNAPERQKWLEDRLIQNASLSLLSTFLSKPLDNTIKTVFLEFLFIHKPVSVTYVLTQWLYFFQVYNMLLWSV